MNPLRIITQRTIQTTRHAGIARFSTASRQAASAAVAVPTSNLSQESRDYMLNEAQREAELPNHDPPKDSATGRLLDSQAKYMIATYSRPPLIFVKGEGCYLYDVENRKYLDFTGGIAVNSLGHGDKGFTRFIAEQSESLVHVSNLYHNAWMGELCKLMVETTKASGAMKDISRGFVCNSGSEANEAAIKFARKVGKVVGDDDKYEFVSFQGSFHGRTMGGLSATPNKKYQAPFAPMLPGFRYGTFNDVNGIHDLVTEKTCGVIVEPIQGEGGVNVATTAFLMTLRKRCSEVGAVLIYDEIQCGLGRTGTLWAHASLPKEAHPDILTCAKALGNGIPIGTTLVTEAVAEKIVIGDHGTTFGGNPFASRVAYHVFSRLSEPKLHQQVLEKGELFKRYMQELKDQYPELITEIRGRGLMLGMQMTRDPTPIIKEARERGLLVITAGTNTLRFVPPLIISEDEIAQGMKILKDVIGKFNKS